MRILLVEDDRLLGRGIVDALTHAGETIDWLQDGQLGLEALRQNSFGLVILDLGLPRLSGIEILRAIRQEGIATPVLILTARDQVEDRVAGLDAGADDYLIKPFDLAELRARIRALLRRSNGHAEPVLTWGDISVDTSTREVSREGQPINLSRREYALLIEMLNQPGRVFSKEQLTEHLYRWDEEVESNTIEVHIHHLRKKLGSDVIKTIRGVGYRITKQAAAS